MNLKVIRLGMVNSFLIYNQKAGVLVDTGLEGSEEKILAAIHETGLKVSDIKLIVLTHNHEDHIGSARAMAILTKAPLLMHKLDYEDMIQGQDGGVQPTSSFGRAMMKGISRAKKASPPLKVACDLLIDEPMDLSEYGIKAKIIPTPGHTRGSLSVLLEDGRAIIGDAMMAFVPFLKPSKPFLARDLTSIKVSLQKLIILGAKRFYLAHGKDYEVETIGRQLRKLF